MENNHVICDTDSFLALLSNYEVMISNHYQVI